MKIDFVEVEISILTKGFIAAVLIPGTFFVIQDIIAIGGIEEYVRQVGIKWVVGLCILWPAMLLIWNNGVMIDSVGIHTWIGLRNTRFCKKVDRDWDEVVIRYYPSWPFSSIGTDQVYNTMFCKYLYTNFEPALAIIGKFGFDKIVHENDKKYFIKAMIKHGVDRNRLRVNNDVFKN